MLRYSLILVIFLGLILYVLHLGKRGQISGRFRAVSLILLGLLTILVGTGLFYSTKYYTVQSVQEEFSENRRDILERIRSLLERGQYEQARSLAEKYGSVQDPALEELYRESREAELLQRAEEMGGSPSPALLEIWEDLAELTGKAEYREKAQRQRRILRREAESRLLSAIDELPKWSVAARALGYARLERIDPRNVTYRQRSDSLKQRARQRIQDSPWNDICSASSVDPCAHFGFFVRRSLEDSGSAGALLGEVLGVSRRAKGTLIDRNGTTAPEDGYYYLVLDAKALSLKDVRFVQVEDPFRSITLPKKGEPHDQQ